MAYTTLLRTDHHTYIDRTFQRGLTSLRDVLREARPAVQLVFLLRVAACADLLRHPSPRGFVGLVGWLLLTVAVYTYNGVTDMAEDQANGSSRPIASGRLPVDVATSWCVVLAGLGLVVCAFTGPVEAAAGAALLAVGWAYSAGPTLKETYAGTVVAVLLLAALSYFGGAAATQAATPKALVVPMSFALWVALCSLAKDFSDVDGDRLAGRRTLPVVLGNLVAGRILAVISVAGALLAVGLALWTRANLAPALGLAIGSAALAATVLRIASDRERSIRRRIYRVLMSTQYLANVMLLVTVP